MKLKILKKFTDKNNGELYVPEQIIDVSSKRGEELLSHPLELVEKIEDSKENTSENDAPKTRKAKKSE